MIFNRFFCRHEWRYDPVPDPEGHEVGDMVQIAQRCKKCGMQKPGSCFVLVNAVFYADDKPITMKVWKEVF